jgi:hypothetical protein
MLQQCLSALCCSLSSLSIVEDMSFVTLYHLGEGDGSHLLGRASAEDLVRVELGRLDLDTVLC